MTFEEARPIVEAMLYEYALHRRQPPAAPVSAVYNQGANPPPKPLPPHSPVERYVLRHEDELRLEAALDRLGATERQAITYRYFDRGRWRYVAKKLNCGETFARRVVERALYALAAQLGMLDGDEPAGMTA